LDIYSLNLSKMNVNYCLVSIDNNWIEQFNEQISKFIIVNLCRAIRLRYISTYSDFIGFFNNIRRNHKRHLINLLR
jgi:hypothetical protein